MPKVLRMGFWDVGPFDNSAAEELVEDLCLRSFCIDQFRFRCEGAAALDADDAATVLALNALIQDPFTRLTERGREQLSRIAAPGNVWWLQNQADAILVAEGSALYAYWESAGELEEWLSASRGVLGALR